MKNLILSAVIASVTVLAYTPSHAQISFPNGDFEAGNDGTPGSGTIAPNASGGTTGTVGVTAALPGGGTTAAYITTDTTGLNYIFNNNIGVANTTGTATFSLDAATKAGNVPVSDPTNEDGGIIFRIGASAPDGMGGFSTPVFSDTYIDSSELNSTSYTKITGTFLETAGYQYLVDIYGLPANFSHTLDATPGTYLFDNVDVPISAPEPTTYALLVAGGIMLLAARRYSKA